MSEVVDLSEALAATTWIVNRYGLDAELQGVPLGDLAALVDVVDAAVVEAVHAYTAGEPAQQPDHAARDLRAALRRVTAVAAKAYGGANLEQHEREIIGEGINLLTDILRT